MVSKFVSGQKKSEGTLRLSLAQSVKTWLFKSHSRDYPALGLGISSMSNLLSPALTSASAFDGTSPS